VTRGAGARNWQEMSDPLTVRATVRTVLREHELVADRSRIAVGDTELATDAIDEVGWSWTSQPSAYKTFLIHSYEFILRADSEQLVFVYEVDLDWAARGIDPTAAAIIRLLETCVYPRIAREIVSRLVAGEPLTAAGLRLDRDGIYVGFRRRSGNLVGWRDVEDLGLDGGKVVLGVRTAKGREFKLRTSTKLPNAVVLPRVLAEMRSRLGFGEQASSPPS
jgi:hypothetical protein